MKLYGFEIILFRSALGRSFLGGKDTLLLRPTITSSIITTGCLVYALLGDERPKCLNNVK